MPHVYGLDTCVKAGELAEFRHAAVTLSHAGAQPWLGT